MHTDRGSFRNFLPTSLCAVVIVYHKPIISQIGGGESIILIDCMFLGRSVLLVKR